MFRDVIYETVRHPALGIGMSLDWKEIAEARQRIEKIIIGKIEEEVHKKIENFLRCESKIVRVSTDLFGYNEIKPIFNNIIGEIETFLKEIVTLGVIHGFRIDPLKGGEMRMIRLDIYLDGEHKRYGYSFDVTDIYRRLW